jgi:hypothetical protein
MHTQLDTLIANAALLAYMPRSRRPAKRCLYMTKDAAAKYRDPNSAVNMLVGKGYVDAAFTKWVLGDRIHNDGTKRKRGRFLKRLTQPPPEIWEFRITDPIPQARVLGRFAEPDIFVVTGFYTRTYLGKKGSVSWTSAINECVDGWNKVFGQTSPYSAGTIHGYVTENCDDISL